MKENKLFEMKWHEIEIQAKSKSSNQTQAFPETCIKYPSTQKCIGEQS